MPRGGYFKLLLYCFTGDRTIEKTGAWAARSHLLRNSLALYRVHVHRSGRKITHTAQFIIQYLPVLVAASSISVVPFSFTTHCRLPNMQTPTLPGKLFILGRPSGSTLSTKKMRILM